MNSNQLCTPVHSRSIKKSSETTKLIKWSNSMEHLSKTLWHKNLSSAISTNLTAKSSCRWIISRRWLWWDGKDQPSMCCRYNLTLMQFQTCNNFTWQTWTTSWGVTVSSEVEQFFDICWVILLFLEGFIFYKFAKILSWSAKRASLLIRLIKSDIDLAITKRGLKFNYNISPQKTQIKNKQSPQIQKT